MSEEKKTLTEDEQKCLAATAHDPLTAELHAAAVQAGVTPAALAQTPQWQERLHPQSTAAAGAESGEPAKVGKREKRRSP